MRGEELYMEEFIKQILSINDPKTLFILCRIFIFTIDSLYLDKVHGLVDEDMYKKNYEKTMKEIKKLELEISELKRQKGINESKQNHNSKFFKCKKVLWIICH